MDPSSSTRRSSTARGASRSLATAPDRANIVPIALASPLHATEGPMTDVKKAAPGSTSTRVFEMRTYHPFPGRAEAMNKRFREHTCELFKKHGMELIGFWTPQDEARKDLLIY